MISRRDMVLGGACAVAAAGAYGLQPRKRLNLLGARKMGDVLPATFGAWESQTVDELVRPATEGRLAALLYSEMVSRIYAHRDTGDAVMMLVAYGDTQSDLLQLHRPESCYPAVGFRILNTAEQALPIAPNVFLPGRRVIADRADYEERILYWARLGEYLPAGPEAQRSARLLTSMKGFIPDGALFRFSSVRRDDGAFAMLEGFIAAMIRAVPATSRPALVGTKIADQIKT